MLREKSKDKYFKGEHRNGSIRLRGWDYSRDGSYFITICTKNFSCCFGNVIDEKMVFSEIGALADRFWREIPKHFDHVKLDVHQIMPNHVHGIIIIDNDGGFPRFDMLLYFPYYGWGHGFADI